MITAATLKTLTTFTPQALTRAIQEAGYKGDRFMGATFLGITNGGLFCYLCTYLFEGEVDTVKVFLTYNPAANKVSADY